MVLLDTECEATTLSEPPAARMICRSDGQDEQGIDGGAAQPEGGDETVELRHQKTFLSPPKKPRGGPNCLAKTPTPVPLRKT